jgi:hypothetical protein
LDTEKLQQAGQPISIIDEEDFIRMSSFWIAPKSEIRWLLTFF